MHKCGVVLYVMCKNDKCVINIYIFQNGLSRFIVCHFMYLHIKLQ